MLNGLRVEKDNLINKLGLMEQKWQQLYDENETLREQIDNLELEAQANHQASMVPVTLDRYVTSASKSLTNLEIDH
jgi:hypothetical protein